MKKIVFSDLPMKKELYSLKYKVDGNKSIEYGKAVLFPVNSVLAKTLKSGDEVKVVLLSKDDENGNSAVNAGLFQKELNEINKEAGAKIEYITVTTPFKETREVHEKLLRDMVGKLEEGAHVIGDITFGPKPLPIVMFAVMNYAEKFFGAEIENIIYGKVDFPNGGGAPANPEIFDLTPLYYLNSLINVMEFTSGEDALKALDRLLDA